MLGPPKLNVRQLVFTDCISEGSKGGAKEGGVKETSPPNIVEDIKEMSFNPPTFIPPLEPITVGHLYHFLALEDGRNPGASSDPTRG